MNCLMKIAITFSMNWATVTSGDHLTFHNKQHVVATAIAIAVLCCCVALHQPNQYFGFAWPELS